MLAGFAPIADADAKLLILGTMPSKNRRKSTSIMDIRKMPSGGFYMHFGRFLMKRIMKNAVVFSSRRRSPRGMYWHNAGFIRDLSLQFFP